jgi:hypothetical protein
MFSSFSKGVQRGAFHTSTVVKECHCTHLPLWSQWWKHGGSFICSENSKFVFGKRGWKTRVLGVKDWGHGARTGKGGWWWWCHIWGKETTSRRKESKENWNDVTKLSQPYIDTPTTTTNKWPVVRYHSHLHRGEKPTENQPWIQGHKPISTFGVFFFFWVEYPPQHIKISMKVLTYLPN